MKWKWMLKRRLKLKFKWTPEFLNNWNTFTKITALVFVLICFMLCLSFMGYKYYRQAKVAMNDVYSNSLISVKLVNEANANIRMIRSVNMELLLAPLDASKKQSQLIQTTVLNGLIKDSLDNYAVLAKEPLEVSKLAQVRDALQKYNEEWQKVVLLMNSGNQEEAYLYFSNNVIKELDTINTLLPELVDFSTQKAKSTIVRENLNFAWAEKLLFGLPLAATILAVIIGALVARAIAKPLQLMLTDVQELASGNLRVGKIKTTSKDEAGRLAQAFNLMTDSLSGLVRQVSVSSADVAASARQLLNITEQSSSASGQISSSIAEVAGGTEKQAAAVNETVAAIEEINANIQRIAEAGRQVTALTIKATATTENGQRALTQAVEQMSNISRSTQIVKGTISSMAEGSEQIAGIARLISDINEQTNLLALNAAIEAARAGEYGRGFSVVAEEVRKLAERAKAATGQITSLVVINRDNINHAIAAMDAEEIHVNDGIKVVDTAGLNLNEILNMVIEVSEQVGRIASSIQQMAGGSQQIVAEIQHMGAVSQGTADQATAVHTIIDKFTASIDQINLSCKKLTGSAMDLQNEIGKFRI